MKDMNCAYCGKDEVLAEFGMFICSLSASRVYLFKEQSHRGRCIVAYKNHIGDIVELDDKDIANYYQDVARVSRVLHKLFNPDKINYGAYGDTAKHIHTHLVPKYKDEFEWGGVFAMNPDRVHLTDAEYAEMAEKIKAALKE